MPPAYDACIDLSMWGDFRLLANSYLLGVVLVLIAGCKGSVEVKPDTGGLADQASADSPPVELVRELKVMTWNVEKLFDTVDNPQDQNDEVLTIQSLNQKIQRLSAVIKSEDPDILALQEVENEVPLDALKNALNEGASKPYEAFFVDNEFGVDVAILSRIPASDINRDNNPDVTVHSATLVREDQSTTFFARRPLEVFFDLGDGKVLSVLTVHFISQRGGDDERRALEAKEIDRIVAMRTQGGIPTLVAGDINDEPDSTTIAALLEGDLEDLTLKVPTAQRWSHIFRGEQSQLDYMVAPPLFNQSFDSFISMEQNVIEAQTSDHGYITAELSVK